jgi:hypothetical protein
MDNEMSAPGNYRVEISGWGLGNNFFVEQIDLKWSEDGGKSVSFHQALPGGAVVFVRLLTLGCESASVPLTYQAHEEKPMDCNGLCEMRLTLLHPRGKESIPGPVASKSQEESERVFKASEKSLQPELEEILQ